MSRTAAPLSAAVLAALGVLAIGCAKPPAPAVEAPVAPAEPAAPVAAPTEVVAAGPPLAAPAVRAIRDGVVAGDATLAADTEAPLAPDGAVDVPERGMAIVSWPEGARAEALGAALRLADSGVRQLSAAQDRGTVRFSIPASAAPPIALEVEAGRATVRSTGGAVDVIISLDGPADAVGGVADAAVDAAGASTGDSTGTSTDASDEGQTNGAVARAADALWVIVIDGAVEVAAETTVASAAGAAAPLRAALSAGQAIAVTAAGAPLAMPVDLAGVETWYGGLIAGDGPPSAASAAFRCQVTAATTTLREQPEAAAPIVDKTVPLARGAILDMRGRVADGGWLQAFLTASERTGWLPAADVQCIAPATLLAVVDPATVHNVDRTALALKAPAAATFVQDKTEIAPGGCAKLNWDVVEGTAVTFDGQAVPGKGFKVLCPAETASYTLAWVDEAGRPQTRRLTITVSAALAVAAADASGGGSTAGGGTGGQASSPTATPCVGPECEVTVPPPPPTATRRARPTPLPAQPTDAPPAPTSPPAATDAPPPPAATDRPADPTATPEAPTPTPTPTPEAPGATDTPPAEPSPSPTPEPTGTPTPTPEATPTP